MKITHVRLLVTEFDACFRFYRDQLGLAVLWGGEGAGYADFRIGEGVGLALFGRSEMAASIGQGHRPVSTDCQDRAMLVVHVDDLDATVDRLKSQGVAVRGRCHRSSGVGHPHCPSARPRWHADRTEQRYPPRRVARRTAGCGRSVGARLTPVGRQAVERIWEKVVVLIARPQSGWLAYIWDVLRYDLGWFEPGRNATSAPA